MSFLSQTKDRLTLEMKKLRLRKNPTPGVISEVVQCCIRLRRFEEACKIAQEGLREFPKAVLLQEIYRIAVRELARDEVKHARKEAREKPSPAAFLRLAKNAIQILDAATAVEALAECIKRYPECAPAHAALGDVYERRYARDLLAVDGRRVIDLLETARRLDPTDLGSQLRLARFLARIGAYALSRKNAEELIHRDSSMDEVRDLLATLPEGGEPEDAEALADILQHIEEAGKMPRDRQDATRTRREVSRLSRGLPKVRERIKAPRAIVVDVNGDAWDEQGTIGVDAMVSMALAMSRSANITTRRSGLGPLRGATLESSGGSLVLRRGYRCTVAALLAAEESIRGTQDALARLLAGAGSGEGGEP